MIDILDVYKAITDGAAWITVDYMVAQIPHYVNRGAIRDLWLEQNHLNFDPSLALRRMDDVILGARTGRWSGSHDNSTFDETLIHGGPVPSKTPRQVLRDTEDGVSPEAPDMYPEEAPDCK